MPISFLQIMLNDKKDLKKQLEAKDKTIKNHAGVIQGFTKSLEAKNEKFDELEEAYLSAVDKIGSMEEMDKYIDLYEKITGKNFKEAMSERSCS